MGDLTAVVSRHKHVGYRMRWQADGMREHNQIVSNSAATASPIQELSIHRLLQDSMECTVIEEWINKVEAQWLLSNMRLHQRSFLNHRHRCRSAGVETASGSP